MQVVVTGLAIAVFIVAAYGDIRRRRIPNGLVLAIGALGLARIALDGDPAEAGTTLLAAAAVLGIGFVLFSCGILGGGDAKLATGAILLVGYHDLFSFLFLMSLCGGALALTVLAQQRARPWFEAFALALRARQRPDGWIMRHPRALAAVEAVETGSAAAAPLSVPYGVAIAAAGIITLGLQAFSPQLFL
jgi:prepilin peptidase CpaA